jgi:hypothetical protein
MPSWASRENRTERTHRDKEAKNKGLEKNKKLNGIGVVGE